MSTASAGNTSSGRPTEVPQESDRYLFGNLDSFAKNQKKLNEVNWSYDQPEGIVLASLDAAIKLMVPCGGWCPEGRLAENVRDHSGARNGSEGRSISRVPARGSVQEAGGQCLSSIEDHFEPLHPAMGVWRVLRGRPRQRG